jgi:1-acyl-sn-glycerol-3-phosphate acyltransferase
VSSRQAFRRVRHAYVAAEEGGLQVAYEDARWRTRGIRPLLALADRLYPMTEAVSFAGEMDRRIRADGLSGACKAGAERLGLDCDFVMSDATRNVLGSAPVIVYGNHPTMLTPFLIGAAAGRRDLRFFMMSYVGHLIPGLKQYMLPLEITSDGWREWRRGGNRRVVAHWLTQILEKGRERADAKPTNRQALGRGARHVASGGCVVIFPSGGGRKDKAWYPGIGHLASQLACDPGASDVFLVPMREEGSSNDHVYAGLRSIGGRARDDVRPSRIRVRFAEPRRLADLVDPADNARAIASQLQKHYEEIFPPAKSRVLEWLFFPRRLAAGRHRA